MRREIGAPMGAAGTAAPPVLRGTASHWVEETPGTMKGGVGVRAGCEDCVVSQLSGPGSGGLER